MKMPDNAEEFNPTRRNLLALAPAATLAAFLAGAEAAQAATETRTAVDAAYDKWIASVAAANAYPGDIDFGMPVFDEMLATEEDCLATPSTSALDILKKIDCFFGGYVITCSLEQDDLQDEINAMVGRAA